MRNGICIEEVCVAEGNLIKMEKGVEGGIEHPNTATIVFHAIHL